MKVVIFVPLLSIVKKVILHIYDVLSTAGPLYTCSYCNIERN